MKVAFVGLGAMGLPMAQCLCKHPDSELTVFDLDPSRMALMGDGAHAASSIADAVSEADLILSVLPADKHLVSLAKDVHRHGKSGQIFLDFSTVLPHTISTVRRKLDAKGIHTVGLGLLRGTPAAQSGSLVLYAGGLEINRPLIEDVLSYMSTDVIDLGTPEAAKALKVANNMVVGCLDALMGEAIAIGEKLGASAEDITRLLIDTGSDSWVLRQHTIPYVLPGDLGPGRFATALMAKDMKLFGQMADQYGRPSRLAAAALGYYRGTIATGHPRDYHPVVVRWLRDGMASATVTPNPDAVQAIVRATAWVQMLVTLDALAVTDAAGISREVAARCMQEGSAGSDSLRDMIRAGRYDVDAADWDVAAAALSAGTEAADLGHAPGLLYEMARLDVVERRARSSAFVGQE